MSLEAWGDCDPAADQPMRECPEGCEYNSFVGEYLLMVAGSLVKCSRCNGIGEIPDEYDPLPDDVI